MSTVSALMSEIRTLSLEDQRLLNKMLVENIRRDLKLKAITSSVKLNIGDTVRFDGKTRGTIVIEITGFSRDLSKVKGRQVNSIQARTAIGTNWTVAAQLCTLIPKA